MARSNRRSSGGRDARLAAPLTIEQKPVLPGIAGGKYKPLSDGEIEQIWAGAYELLETVGMADGIPHCLDLVTKAGGTLTDDGRLLFPEKLLDWTLGVAAKEFTLQGFDPKFDLHISDEHVHFRHTTRCSSRYLQKIPHQTQAVRQILKRLARDSWFCT